MSYVDRVLQPGETILYSATLHWGSYLPAIAFFVAGVGLAIGSMTGSPDYQIPMRIGAVALGALAIIAWIPVSIRRRSTQYVVTDRRVILKRGILSRHTIEMNRSKVESVDVDQTLLGRIFGYGTVIVRGTGGGLEPIRNIADPLAFRTRITAGETSA
jgi:uncharacterized membrane protein YdbT with pleckstrin-like domain